MLCGDPSLPPIIPVMHTIHVAYQEYKGLYYNVWSTNNSLLQLSKAQSHKPITTLEDD
jgi:hypothetical protein